MKKRILFTILILFPIFSLIAAPEFGPGESRPMPPDNPDNIERPGDGARNPPPKKGPGDRKGPGPRDKDGDRRFGENESSSSQNQGSANSIKNSVNAKSPSFGSYQEFLHSQEKASENKAKVDIEDNSNLLQKKSFPLTDGNETNVKKSDSNFLLSISETSSSSQNEIINYRGNRKVVSNTDISLLSYSFNNSDEKIIIELNFNQSVNPKSITKDNILIDGEKICQKCKISFNKNSDSVKILIDGKSLAEVKNIELFNIASIDGGKINSFIFESAIN
ncbi:MAG: hypothetical protein K5829_13630 [Treponema sp.]|nr:hypothetical protein [Treponema sp.]